MAKTIRFIKNNGEVQYKQNILNNLDNAFNTIKNGEYILTVSKEVKKRSLDQNALMWLWFTCIEMKQEQIRMMFMIITVCFFYVVRLK
jgi:hypothetical protein